MSLTLVYIFYNFLCIVQFFYFFGTIFSTYLLNRIQFTHTIIILNFPPPRSCYRHPNGNIWQTVKRFLCVHLLEILENYIMTFKKETSCIQIQTFVVQYQWCIYLQEWNFFPFFHCTLIALLSYVPSFKLQHLDTSFRNFIVLYCQKDIQLEMGKRGKLQF